MDHNHQDDFLLLNTVIEKYEPLEKNETGFESEQALEAKFIEQLIKNGYEYRQDINDDESLEKNLRFQIEKLNQIQFTDQDWKRFSEQYLMNLNLSQTDKNINIQDEDHLAFNFESGELKNIKLIDKKNLSNNHLQVINQFKKHDGRYDARYDVTILVNGLPLTHVELKRRGVLLKEAYNQIMRYKKENFSYGNRLFEFVQIFIISNGTETRYFSNTTLNNSSQSLRSNVVNKNNYKTQSSYEFTINWSDQKNNNIIDILDFTNTFLQKTNLLNIITKYCVLTDEGDNKDRQLKVMRPYQIAATEAIINKVYTSTKNNTLGDIKTACGYIWHTTGSGKTLTSFKTATLLKKILPEIKKVFFVVDRRDLDVQTSLEFNKFKVDTTKKVSNTKELEKSIKSDEQGIIVTTIQKLSKLVSEKNVNDIFNEHVVFIFDECHRTQFGEMHAKIVKSFNKYNMFGFTGTPIFIENANNRTMRIEKDKQKIEIDDPNLEKYINNAKMKLTTEDLFGECLHVYNIIDAIKNNSVLPFKIEYFGPKNKIIGIDDEKVKAIDEKKYFLDPRRIHEVAKNILKNFSMFTKRTRGITFNHSMEHGFNGDNFGQQTDKKGFNSIFAVDSVDAAIAYYNEFKKLQKDIPQNERLKIATIFTFDRNKSIDEDLGILPDDDYELNENLGSDSQRAFLDQAIEDYNDLCLGENGEKTNFSTKNNGFHNYFESVLKNMKNRKIDILIVVNMFLTGFDAPSLNTLWVDKNLQYHGLIQAYSRTNRILDETKPYGTIVCFRNLKKATDDALRLFGMENEGNYDVVIQDFNHYYYGDLNTKNLNQKLPKTIGYKTQVENLVQQFPIYSLNNLYTSSIENKTEFVNTFNNILKSVNFLQSFNEFTHDKRILTDRQLQDYLSVYNELYLETKKRNDYEKAYINDNVVFEINLIKEYDIDTSYIQNLIKNEIRQQHKITAKFIENARSLINSSLALHSKRELLIRFLDSLTNLDYLTDEDLYRLEKDHIKKSSEEELEKIINKYDLKANETRQKISQCFSHDHFEITNSDINALLKQSRLLSLSKNINPKGSNNKKDIHEVVNALYDYYETYNDILDQNLNPIVYFTN